MALVGQFSPAEIDEMEVQRAGETLLTQALLGPTQVEQEDGQEVERLSGVTRDQAETLGALIRAGATPESASRQLGLTGFDFVDALPITLKPKRLLEAETEATEAEAQSL